MLFCFLGKWYLHLICYTFFVVKLGDISFSEFEVSTLILWVVMLCGLVNRYIPEDGGSIFVRNVDIYLQVRTTLQPGRKDQPAYFQKILEHRARPCCAVN
jgi:hypothetical protein